MPRFAANLSMMFNEVPFMGRFAAAARAASKEPGSCCRTISHPKQSPTS